jgi:hypothetical protein
VHTRQIYLHYDASLTKTLPSQDVFRSISQSTNMCSRIIQLKKFSIATARKKVTDIIYRCTIRLPKIQTQYLYIYIYLKNCVRVFSKIVHHIAALQSLPKVIYTYSTYNIVQYYTCLLILAP